MSNLYLAHHGVKGQKHGVRQWQNPDGSLTPAGRIHYGVGEARKAAGSVAKTVGKASKSVGKAIRKKVAPTNAELNAQIRKQKSKNLNKQKRRELRDLKRGIDVDASSSSENKLRGQHKRFSEMSDQDIENRIRRLQNEVKLAELEATKSFGPGRRLIYEALKDGGKRAISNIVGDELTKAGKAILDVKIDKKKEQLEKKTTEGRTKSYTEELAERKAKKELKDWKKENPEGLGKLSPSSRKAVKEAKAKKDQEKAAEKLKADAEDSKNRQVIEKERRDRLKEFNDSQKESEERIRKAESDLNDRRARQARGLEQTGHTNEEIAKMMGIPEWEVGYLLYEKKKKDNK